MVKQKLRCYFVEFSDDGEGVAIIAESYYQAKATIASNYSAALDELRCHVLPHFKLKKSDKVGEIEIEDGLRRCCYGNSGEQEVECEVCHEEKMFVVFEDKLICDECLNKEVEKKVKP